MRPEIYHQYKELFTAETMMGPNTIRLLDEIVERYPLTDKKRIMDLGCGTGMSSRYLAEQTQAQIFAVDLWISATDNDRRFTQWNLSDRMIPIHANALDLPFANGYFDAIVSIDAYHYFGCDPDYFSQKLLPLVSKGGKIRIVVPGLREEFGETIPQIILDWLGDEYTTFHDCAWWKKHIGEHEAVTSVNCFTLSDNEAPWQEWFDSGHKYGVQDQEFFKKGLGQYLAFVGIAIEL